MNSSNRKGIPLVWTKHLKEEAEKDSFESLLRNSVQLFTVLRKILRADQKQIERKELSLSDFEDSSWAFKQAFRNGYKSALESQIRLTDFIERK